MSDHQLRVALLAGGLTQGGAEKQLTYMAKALLASGVAVRIYGLTLGDYYQDLLAEHAVPYEWVGSQSGQFQRLQTIYRRLKQYQPHIVQSTHFFTNLYAAIAGRLTGAVTIGSIRSNVYREVKANGMWGPWLLRLPKFLILNSQMARSNALASGLKESRLFVLPNVIDLDDFDRQIPPAVQSPPSDDQDVVVMTVARFVKAKRLEHFLTALASARSQNHNLRGVIAGDGPERESLEKAAHLEGLIPGGVEFLGMRSDIPALLSGADFFAISSEIEGFPNAILEAMAARLPVITTPAGDAAHIVQHGITGYVVPHNNPDAMAEKMVLLASSPELRQRFGAAGRDRVQRTYSYQTLAAQLISIYKQAAALQHHTRALAALKPENLTI